jgi:hypothetical protein
MSRQQYQDALFDVAVQLEKWSHTLDRSRDRIDDILTEFEALRQ